MMESIVDTLVDVVERGGPVMVMLLTLSVVAVTLIFERVWFWVGVNNPGRLARVGQLTRLLRKGDTVGARALAQAEGGIYSRVALRLLEEQPSDALAAEIVETERPRLERYMALFNTLITGAPLLGLVGSVLGLITTFRFLSSQSAVGDPRSVGVGLAEALYNTAGGLFIALLVLFPYNAFRVQIDRTLGRIELLIAAARQAAQRPVATPAVAAPQPPA